AYVKGNPEDAVEAGFETESVPIQELMIALTDPDTKKEAQAMGNQMKGSLYYFTTQAKRSLYLFWSTFGISLLASFIISVVSLQSSDETTFFFMLSFAVYVFSAFYGFISIRYELPFSIKMGATRKHFWFSRFIFFIGLTICQIIIVQ